MDHLYNLCVVFVMLLRLFIAALWSPALIALFFVMLNCDFVTFPCDILGRVWYLMVSIRGLNYTHRQHKYHICLMRAFNAQWREHESVCIASNM